MARFVGLTCPKGCVRSAARFANGVLTFSGRNALGLSERKAAREVRVPDALHNAFDDMVGRTSLRHSPPVLEFYDDLHGVGGLFVPDQWAILVGMQDQRDIASTVIAQSPDRLRRIFARHNGGRIPSQVELLQFVHRAAILRCMAHELGHAMIHAGHQNPYAPDQEAGADFYAGKFDGALGLDPELGALIFYAIGCVGPSCRHPAPYGRASAYASGNAQQRRSA